MCAMQCHAPERIGPLAVSDDGSMCCGGGVSGRLYLWEVGSGALVRSWDAHYKVYIAYDIHYILHSNAVHASS
jgi:pre-rRNA-processing protein IPI3